MAQTAQSGWNVSTVELLPWPVWFTGSSAPRSRGSTAAGAAVTHKRAARTPAQLRSVPWRLPRPLRVPRGTGLPAFPRASVRLRSRRWAQAGQRGGWHRRGGRAFDRAAGSSPGSSSPRCRTQRGDRFSLIIFTAHQAGVEHPPSFPNRGSGCKSAPDDPAGPALLPGGDLGARL